MFRTLDVGKYDLRARMQKDTKWKAILGSRSFSQRVRWASQTAYTTLHHVVRGRRDSGNIKRVGRNSRYSKINLANQKLEDVALKWIYLGSRGYYVPGLIRDK